MPASPVPIAGAQAAADGARDWQALHDAGDIQFAPLPPAPPQPTPDWLIALGRFLQRIFQPIGEAIGLGWPAFEKLLIAAGVALLLFFLWRLVAPWIAALRKPAAKSADPEWVPDRSAALALLEDADRLAAEGRFNEAAHLLLQRSVEQISAAKPGLLHPASTAREIAASPSLPAAASLAFGVIAGRVERSRFALRALLAEDWQAARKAYADFAATGMA